MAAILLTGLLAGCGGGQSEGESGGAGEQEGGEAAKKDAPETKTALGTIRSVKTENKKIILNRTVVSSGTGERKEEPAPFKLTKQAKITLDNEPVELADIKEGQQAQITYVAKNQNLAREVVLVGDGGAPPAAGEGTG
jgi:hypothetical protein